MKIPIVSIVIPIYNAQLTLERCLASVKRQSYKNFEVIMINDGSSDHSLQICLKYTNLDPRFKLLNKENSGVSNSRNLGMAMAKGKYIQFLDSDDWITKEATESLVTAAEVTNCELVISGFYRVIGKKSYPKGQIKLSKCLTRQEFAEYMMEAPANFYYGVLWNKLFRLDIIRKHDLKCDEDLNWCEDFQFNLEYLSHVQLVTVVDKPLYYYLKRQESLSATQITIKKTILMKKQLFEYYKELYKSIDLYEENKWKISKFLVSCALDGGKTRKITQNPQASLRKVE